MTLENYLKDKKIESIGPSPEGAKTKLNKAFKIFRNIKNITGVADNEVIYPLAHDAARISCETILLMAGYRVKRNIEGNHYITIDCAKELVGEALGLEFARLQRMRKQRNMLEYGDLDSVSLGDLEQAVKDLEKLLVYASRLLEKETRNDKLF